MSVSFGSNISPVISFHCVLLFRSTTYKPEITSTRIYSLRKSIKKDQPGSPTYDIHINCCLLGFREIGTHAFGLGSPGMEPEFPFLLL